MLKAQKQFYLAILSALDMNQYPDDDARIQRLIDAYSKLNSSLGPLNEYNDKPFALEINNRLSWARITRNRLPVTVVEGLKDWLGLPKKAQNLGRDLGQEAKNTLSDSRETLFAIRKTADGLKVNVNICTIL